MAALMVEQNDETNRSARYRIVPVGPPAERRWRLETAPPGNDDSPEWSTASVHHTLATARYRARSLAQEQMRRDRVRTRIVIGGLALAGWPLVALTGSGLVALVVSSILFGLAVASLGAAIAIRFGYAGRWSNVGRGDTGVLDRIAAPIIASVRRQHTVSRAGEESRVRVLPPQEHRSLHE